MNDNIICKAIAYNDTIISSGKCLANILIEKTCYVPRLWNLSWNSESFASVHADQVRMLTKAEDDMIVKLVILVTGPEGVEYPVKCVADAGIILPWIF